MNFPHFLLLATCSFLPLVLAREAVDDPPEYTKAVCKGGKLLQAMKLSAPDAGNYITPVDSPWDGTLVNELAEWGYAETSRNDYCDLSDPFFGMATALDALGVNGWSVTTPGGQNQCYEIDHSLPGNKQPVEQQTYTVNGQVYKMTRAESIVAINAQAGMIFLLNIESPYMSAKTAWKNPPTDNELPALRTQSDFAWGFWNRQSAHNLGGIKALWSVNVVNTDTTVILARIWQKYTPAPGQARVNQAPLWPGIDFYTSTEEGQALLGCPNGIGPGYFLAQHKRQLGGNKYINRITVYRTKQFSSVPNFIHWVDDVPMARRDEEDLGVPPVQPNTISRRVNRIAKRFGVPRTFKKREEMALFRVHIIQLGS